MIEAFDSILRIFLLIVLAWLAWKAVLMAFNMFTQGRMIAALVVALLIFFVGGSFAKTLTGSTILNSKEQQEKAWYE